MNKLTNTSLLIDAIRQMYPDDTKQYLFKSCGEIWIVVMRKLSDTITNQSRLEPDHPSRQFISYRANKLMVVNIINKFNPNETINEISNTFYKGHTIKYIKGNVVVPDLFDSNINNVCSNGIHFYEKIECAFYLELEKVENGKLTEWYEDGQIKEEGEYLNGMLHGRWTFWYDNGQKRSEGEYLNGLHNGAWTFWHYNGKKHEEGEFLLGKKHGKWNYWYFNGKYKAEIEFRNGKKYGKCTTWYNCGGEKSEEEYVDGELHGKQTTWHENGKEKSKCEYLNGKLHGILTEWFSNGQKESEGKFINGKPFGVQTKWDVKGNMTIT